MYTGRPQTGQNPRVFTLPLSPTMSQCLASPVNVTPARAKVMYEPWPLPLSRWQSRHWQ
jgi:hypothetical protein